MQKIKDDLKPYFKLQNYKQFLVPTIVMFGIYLLGILSIIRDDISFADDYARATSGGTMWAESFSRYISEIIAIIINTNIRLTDISPIPQILAALILAVSNVILIYILCDKKISRLALIASIPLGLSPYFLQCLSWKFDAPYMALSVFVCIVPFLFTKNKIIFSIISIISIWVMCMTYQTSSGIYIMLVIIISFQNWISKKRTYKEISQFILITALSYCFALLVFKFCFMRPLAYNYVDSSIFPLKDLPLGFAKNLLIYIKNINLFAFIWKILVILVAVFFIVKSIIISKRNKFAVFFTSTAVVAILPIASFGVYLAFQKPLFDPRGSYGFGVCIAILGIITAAKPHKWLSVPAFALSWCFFVFALSYGNALSDQTKYNKFRIEIILQDLSTLFPDRQKTLPVLLNMPHTQEHYHSSIVKNVAVKNPVIKHIIANQLTRYFGPYVAKHYYDMYHIDNSLYNGKTEDFDTVLLDNYYHTIKSNGKQVLVILK